MKSLKQSLIGLLISTAILPAVSWSQARNSESVAMGSAISFRDLPIQTAMKLIASRMELSLDMDPKIQAKLSYSFENLPIEAILETVTRDNKLFYEIADGTLYIGTLNPEGEGSAGPDELNVQTIEIRNTTAQDILQRLPKFLAPEESLQADESSNKLIFYGRKQNFKRLLQMSQAMDTFPKQILIQAQIVETSKSFSRALGLMWGHAMGADGTPTGDTSVNVAPALPDPANFMLRTLTGIGGGRALEARLLAAEDDGEAKILSKPRIVTLNNKPAVIHSGIIFNVRTLSAATTGESEEVSSIAGGLQQISAGLDLNVLPVVVGQDMIRLDIGVSNSEPNYSLAVDNIPGITDNSANASIIVQDGKTVIMAGLIKSTLSETYNGVPWLKDIPILGWLFRSRSSVDRDSELVIFITPKLIDPRSVAEAVGPAEL